MQNACAVLHCHLGPVWPKAMSEGRMVWRGLGARFRPMSLNRHCTGTRLPQELLLLMLSANNPRTKTPLILFAVHVTHCQHCVDRSAYQSNPEALPCLVWMCWAKVKLIYWTNRESPVATNGPTLTNKLFLWCNEACSAVVVIIYPSVRFKNAVLYVLCLHTVVYARL